MDIRKYTGYFHDGEIYEILHKRYKMIISMDSAEMDEEDLVDDVVLSKDGGISGRLHIERIKNIKINHKSYFDTFNMFYEDAGIHDFEMDQTNVRLAIRWGTYRPKPPVNDWSILEIEAGNVWWKNIPDLI